LLASKPVVAVKSSRLVAKGHTLELPTKVGVYFTGKDGYEVKDLTVKWDEVPAENLANAGEFTVHGRVLGTDLTAEVAVRVTDKLGENLSDNPDFDDDSNRSFASATNDIDPSSRDRVDYVNDGSDDESRRWTNWSASPSDNPEVSVGVIFKEAGKIVERTVAEGSIRFFSDGGTNAPSKLVLERYIGPDFDAPEYYSNYQPYNPEHPFNTPSNWEKVEYRADQEIEAGTDIHVTFAPVKTKAMRWRMDRKADKKGVAITEMTFIAPSEEPKDSTSAKLLVDGKELADFSEDRVDYRVTYTGTRPNVTVEAGENVAATVVDSGDDKLPVLVHLVSESGKHVKEYRIQLTKSDAESAKTEPAVHEIPEYTGGVNGEEAAVLEVPEFTGGVNAVEAAVNEVPEYTGGVNAVEAAVNDVPEYKGGANAVFAAVNDVPEYTGGVNAVEAAVNEVPEYKDEQSIVALAMSQDKTYQAPASHQHILPETGTKENATLATAGVVGALLGLFAMGKKKDEE